MTELSADAKEAKELVTQTSQMVVELGEFEINSNETYVCAGEHLKLVKAKANALTEKRLEITRPMDAAKKKVMDFFKPPIEALNLAESGLKRKMTVFSQEQERIRRAAERQRQAQEQADREKAEAEALELAQIAEGEGDKETAEAILEEAQQPITPAAPVVVAEKPKAAGISMRDNYKAEVTDLMALVKAVAAGDAPITMIKADDSALNKMAKATKGSVKMAGVRFYNDPVIASRA